MHRWAEQLVFELEQATGASEVFSKIETAARTLGFEGCAYGLRTPLPFSKPKVWMMTNYAQSWQQRYQDAHYVEIDPTVRHARRSQAPVLWSEALFAHVPEFWAEARAAGLQHGWAQSVFDPHGVGGMLTLARSSEPVTAAELEENEFKMRWLVSVAHLSLTSRLLPALIVSPVRELTEREIEVLKWAADGKTSNEISKILIISEDTVNFHVKNAITKLKTVNKTAAVARAAMLGLLN